MMNSSLTALLFSVGAVTLAEIGDKTQLLAMAFATKYQARKVLWGVFLATIFNHALAVALGHYLTKFQAAEVWIQGIAALSFVFFGLWTIRGDQLDGEENRTTKYGAVMTVALAFFIAELGDKTQLATIALAAKFPAHPIWILMGTTTGMMIADGLGIIIGVAACKKIPERTIKLVSAGAFIIFGLIGIYQVSAQKLNLPLVTNLLILGAITLITILSGASLLRQEKPVNTNPVITEACPLKKQK